MISYPVTYSDQVHILCLLQRNMSQPGPRTFPLLMKSWFPWLVGSLLPVGRRPLYLKLQSAAVIEPVLLTEAIYRRSTILACTVYMWYAYRSMAFIPQLAFVLSVNLNSFCSKRKHVHKSRFPCTCKSASTVYELRDSIRNRTISRREQGLIYRNSLSKFKMLCRAMYIS